MDAMEAGQLLQDQLRPWRARSHADLTQAIGETHRFEATGASGRWYQGNVQVFWDDRPGGVVRVLGAIDDGGLRAFAPLTDDFLVPPSA